MNRPSAASDRQLRRLRAAHLRRTISPVSYTHLSRGNARRGWRPARPCGRIASPSRSRTPRGPCCSTFPVSYTHLTVTREIGKAIADAKAGKIEYRLDKTNIIHCPIGKASFGAEKLGENFNTLLDAIVKAKPASCLLYTSERRACKELSAG